MQTTFFTADTARYAGAKSYDLIHSLEGQVNQWHKEHLQYHTKGIRMPVNTSFRYCIHSTSAGPDYFTITHFCDFRFEVSGEQSDTVPENTAP